MSTEPTPLKIRGELILLGQLVKFVGLIGTGGEVKDYLATAKIEVNGEAENRRGRKIRPGDIVHLPDGRVFRIEGDPAP